MDFTGISNWLLIHDPVPALGVILTLGTLWLSWRVDRRQREVEVPAVDIALQRSELLPGWHTITISIRNRTDSNWMIEWAEVRPFDACRAVPYRLASAPTGLGGLKPVLEKATANAQSGRIAVGLRVDVGGTIPHNFKGGDHTSTQVFVLLERPVKRLSIKLSLRSSAARERVKTITTYRSVVA